MESFLEYLFWLQIPKHNASCQNRNTWTEITIILHTLLLTSQPEKYERGPVIMDGIYLSCFLPS